MNSAIRLTAIIVALFAFGAASTAHAQRSSLYQRQSAAVPLSLENNSWLYVAMPPVRELQVNDLVTILVKQKQQSQSEGEINRIQQSSIDARLRDWVKLEGFGITAAPQTQGDPRARGSLDSTLRTNAELETASFIQFNITATVVDIRPNGNLVLEAHSTVKDNNETWEASLSGIVRREDIQPDNTVFSEKIAELSIHKRETGHINDAYRRGWALRAYDKFKPF
jgi:flagellar L-ring protein precursor FlgH